MAISYPVDVVHTRWSVLEVSSGLVIARNKVWPVADGGPIQGQDPNYVYLLQITNAEPDYDSRLYQLVSEEVVDAAANEIRRSWSTTALPTDERKANAENEEAARFSRFVRLEREAIQTRLMVGAILSYIVDAQQFPPKVRTMSDEYVAKAVKVWNNRDRLETILAEIELGQDPNLDDGWEE